MEGGQARGACPAERRVAPLLRSGSTPVRQVGSTEGWGPALLLRLRLAPEGLVVLRALHALDKVASLCHPPRRHGPPGGVVVVQAARLQVGLQMPRGLHCMVARQSGEEVVANVRRANVVVHPVKDPVWPVDGAEGALDPRPVLIAVVRDRGIGVLQPRVKHQPGVGPQVRQPVEHEDRRQATAAPEASEGQKRQPHAEAGKADAHAPALREERGTRPEVVDEAALHRHGLADRLPVEPAAAGDVEQEVGGPAHHQVVEELNHGKAIISNYAVHGLKAHRTQLLPSVRHVRLPIHQVIGLGVVLRMRELPREIRHQEEGVEHPTHGVVEGPVLREAAVPALVRQHPPTDGGGSLREAVDRPSGPLPCCQGAAGTARNAEEGRGQEEDRGQHDSVAQHEDQRAGGAVPEALLGHGGPQLCDRGHLRRLRRPSGLASSHRRLHHRRAQDAHGAALSGGQRGQEGHWPSSASDRLREPLSVEP
mmetsp:Transcript_94666/g.251426  ORF Transcript_94666/g.251426 Transcript_94666/m.251426 type:complete len:480 (-) Transcript_94666:7-1446(-)